jgi:hypothetical protein
LKDSWMSPTVLCVVSFVVRFVVVTTTTTPPW